MADRGARGAGSMFGPYRLDRLLGRGGMGEVYQARDTRRDRDVALKLLSTEVSANSDFHERFRRECHVLAQLGEPHIIPIHNYGDIESQLYLEMRLVDGRNLRELLRDGALDPGRAIAVIEQVGAALDAVHAVGIVHRDVKPDNVLVTSADFAYLIDFGIAMSESDTHLTRTGDLIGSIAYIAPELFSDMPATPVSDVYSLAVVLYELLTAAQPYPGGTVTAITKKVLFDEVPSVRAVNAAVPAALDDVVRWGLAKDPSDRCPSALDFVRGARRALEQSPARSAETDVLPGAGVDRPPNGGGAGGAPTLIRPGGASWGGPQQNGAGPSGMPPTGHSVPPQPQYAVANSPAKRGTSPFLVVAGILLVALVGGGVWLLSAWFSTPDSPQTAAHSTAVPVVDEGTAATAVPTADAATPVQQPTALPPGAKPCPGIPGLATHEGRKTSCEFAVSVRDAYRASGPQGGSRTVNGWAPQQQASVPMFCGPEYGIVICRGGTQSIVYLY